MKSEIGSFFESEEDTGDDFKLETSLDNWICEKANVNNIELLCSGREAIEAAILDIEKKNKDVNKVCLLPAYTCDTVIIPFQKHGWDIYFYLIDKELMVTEQRLQLLMEKIRPSVLLIHTYYGVDTMRQVRELISRWRKERELILIEDLTQSFALLENKEIIADYYVGSLRKWFAIPDGGFIASDFLSVRKQKEKENFVQIKKEAQRLKYKYLHGDPFIQKKDLLALNLQSEQYLYENDSICSISDYSAEKLNSLDFQKNFQKRKENAEFLFENIRNLKKIVPAIDVRGASPLYFPFYTEDREEGQRILRENNIFAPILWPMPEEIKSCIDRDTNYVFEHLLALPCDQRYSIKDMEKIIQCLLEYEERGSI